MVERDKSSRPKAKPVLGWREWIALPDLGIHAIRAKIDTGARSSALHVDAFDTFHSGGREWVRFTVATGSAAENQVVVESTVHDRRQVTDSGGHVSERIFLLTRLVLAGQAYPVEINLTSRRNMLFPMLLGRTALKRRFVIDPARSFRAGRVSRATVDPR
ncbi:MAG TPA: RimK/LysX family protein [Xanthomonadaceae bacterium]|jgi:hypothetical protein